MPSDRHFIGGFLHPVLHFPLRIMQSPFPKPLHNLLLPPRLHPPSPGPAHRTLCVFNLLRNSFLSRERGLQCRFGLPEIESGPGLGVGKSCLQAVEVSSLVTEPLLGARLTKFGVAHLPLAFFNGDLAEVDQSRQSLNFLSTVPHGCWASAPGEKAPARRLVREWK